MHSISEVRAFGYDTDGVRVEWIVALYVDAQEALKHFRLCHDYLARAEAELAQQQLSHNERKDAMRWLRPSHDPQYAQKQAFDVTYSLDAHPLSLTAPGPDAQTWRALDAADTNLRFLVSGAARRFMRDEELEGEPQDPLPRKEQAVRALWLIGVNPAMPAMSAEPGATGADVYYRLFTAAVAERRQALRDSKARRAA